MKISNNLAKYQSKNPLKKIFIGLFIKKIVGIVKTLDIQTILDAGCGEGLIMKKIYSKTSDFKIDGLDISSQSIDMAKKLLPGHNFFVGNIGKMPFADNSYDLIMALEVLEHLLEPPLALKEIKRIAKKYCLISVPWEPYFSLANFLSGKNIARLGADSEHVNFWSRKKIINLTGQYFNIISVQISFPWIIILAKK